MSLSNCDCQLGTIDKTDFFSYPFSLLSFSFQEIEDLWMQAERRKVRITHCTCKVIQLSCKKMISFLLSFYIKNILCSLGGSIGKQNDYVGLSLVSCLSGSVKETVTGDSKYVQKSVKR